MEVQEVQAVKYKTRHTLEVFVVLAAFEEGRAILDNDWLVTEFDWPLKSSIQDNRTGSKLCSIGILVLFKVDTGLVK